MTQQTTALRKVLGSRGTVVDCRSVGDGCISEAMQVRLEAADGSLESLLVKSNEASFLDNFQCEAEGLRQLHAAGAIRVPEPLDVSQSAGKSWLVCEWIEQGRRGQDFFERFGEQLAKLHRATAGERIGWDRDNHLGAAPQMNASAESWPEFFAEHRIGFQIRWAQKQGLADRALQDDCEAIMARMDQLLEGRDLGTSLLHGDLWSGNYLCDADGQPVIIDPAVYYGCREAEFGMIRLFGSCPGTFYDAYQAHWPMPGGWQRRVDVYVLYHLLNHLNLFGSGYLGQSRQLAAEILRS